MASRLYKYQCAIGNMGVQLFSDGLGYRIGVAAADHCSRCCQGLIIGHRSDIGLAQAQSRYLPAGAEQEPHLDIEPLGLASRQLAQLKTFLQTLDSPVADPGLLAAPENDLVNAL